MKKIYSLVLMAAMLLLGTNAWAGNVTGNNRAALQAAIDGAASGTTLTLQNDFTLDGPVWLGTADLNGAYKTIILDLNGHKISMATGGANAYMFVLTHGELLVRNSSATQALIEMTGSTGKNNNTQVFSVFGSYRSSRWNEAGTQADAQAINTRDQGWFSHLEIGNNVKIVTGSGILGSGIAVDELFATEGAIAKVKALGHTINYTTNILGVSGGRGLAQGVRVDVYGDIEIPGKGETGSYKAYCVKVNGMVDQPHSTRDAFKEDYYKSGKLNTVCPFKNVDYVQNYVSAEHVGDTIDVPFIYIHNTANLKSDNKSSRSTAVYSSGYSKMLIEGYCEGAVGVYANSGKVEIHDAEVVSTSTTYTTPTSDGGAQGSGSAIVVNSRDNYTGSVEVVISGDSKVTATTGYAIEEIVNTTTTNTKVDNVEITGGTIEGGDKGAIIVSDATATDENAHVTVYGGNVTGNTQVGKTGDITDILPTDNNNTPTAHVTVVTDPETGKQTLVVSDGATAPAAQTEWTDIMALAAGADVNWTGTTAGVLGNGTDAASKVLGELQMISGTSANPQLLTVKNKATLTVDHLVMNKYAQIVVEAGGKFIVAGEQGIVAPSDHNIVLKASESQQAYFIFHPSVTSNRHPNATVEFSSKGYYVSNSDFANQRFGLPMFDGLDSITTKYNNADVATGFGAFDGNDWVVLGFINMTPALNLEDMAEPFTYYQMQHNAPEMGTMVRMYGKLYGNTSPELNIKASRWNAFANSFSAPIDGQTLINLIPNSVDKTFYLYDITKDQAVWKSYTLLNINMQGGIRPMQPFLIRNTQGAANVTVDYQQAVYNPAITAAAGAPARHRTLDDITKAELIVSGENGADYVLVAENDQFTAEFDNGYDAAKYMNDGINMYVSANEKMSIFATDNLENTYVGFQAVKGGNYTIEFANVQGEDLILIDLETGARVAMVEGGVYEFTADANSVNDYRFQITKINKVATDIENTEAVKSAKGIYTITGQYVGEMNLWNTLPAGVYVVNGEKCVK
jgi:hypothetical protein